jgi:hypothetical protein
MTTRAKTTWPKLSVGETYEFVFTDPDTGARRYGGTWTIAESGDTSMGAFRAYVMRWTRHGMTVATIVKVS